MTGGMFVALSCLQGRPSIAAFDELATLGAGIQLTPGNLGRLRGCDRRRVGAPAKAKRETWLAPLGAIAPSDTARFDRGFAI